MFSCFDHSNIYISGAGEYGAKTKNWVRMKRAFLLEVVGIGKRVQGGCLVCVKTCEVRMWVATCYHCHLQCT